MSLSDDAKAVLGSVLHAGIELKFQLVESRPTPRAQAALDELVAAGAATKTNLPWRADGRHGVAYRAAIPTGEFVKFVRNAKGFVLTEKIPTGGGQ